MSAIALSLSSTQTTVSFSLTGLTAAYASYASADIYQGTSTNGTYIDNIWFSKRASGYSSLSGTFSNLQSGTNYFVIIYVWQSDGQLSGTWSGRKATTSPPTYTVSATVTFNANGGSVSPTSQIGSTSTTSSGGAYVDVYFPTPTRSGYTFLYWLLDGYTTQYSGGQYNGIWGEVGGATYTARAQWRQTSYTASATVTFDANGGSVFPSSASGSASTSSQYGAYVNVNFPTPTRSGFVFLYWLLDGDTTHYSGGQTYGIWGEVGGVTYTARAQWRTGITPWSWSASNGDATAAQTQQFYNVLRGNALPETGFSHLVWNDLVDKAQAVVSAARPGVGWTNYGGLSSSGCKVSADETLSADKYNSVRYNLDSISSTGIADKNRGDEIKGYYITTLTDVINQIISTML